jgi:hypothetical protein
VRRAAAIVLLALAVTAEIAAAQPLQCTGNRQAWMVAELLFGREHVSEARWRQFLADEITPRFPDGLTVYDARGQWRAPGGRQVTRERSKVVMIAMPPAADNDARLQQIVEAYKTRFHQRSVGLIVHPACVAF